MPLQSQGLPISLQDIEDEFGGDHPIPISDYIRGGPYVKTGSSANADIPTSTSNIQFSDFYSAANVYETIVLAQGSTVQGDQEADSPSGPPAFGWVYFFVWSDGTDTFVSAFTFIGSNGTGTSTYQFGQGSASAGSYNGSLIYTVNLGGNYYCKATVSNASVSTQSASTPPIVNDFSSYTQIPTGTEAASKVFSVRAHANADVNNDTAFAISDGRLTFDFNSDGGTNAEFSIYWDYHARAYSETSD